MKNKSKHSKESITNEVLEYLNDQYHLFHLLFEIVIIIILVSVIDSIVIPNQDIFSLLSLLVIVSIVIDYYLWNNLYQSLLFGLIVLGYLYYSNHQKNYFKSFYQQATLKKLLKQNEIGNNETEDDNWSTLTNYSNTSKHLDTSLNNFRDINGDNDGNDGNGDNDGNDGNGDNDGNDGNDNNQTLDYQKAIPNPNVLDFIPDDVNKEIKVVPYMKGIKEPNIDSGLDGLPTVDYSDTPVGKMNNDILVALDDRHTIPLMQNELIVSEENVFRQEKNRNALGVPNNRPKNVKLSNKSWNLDRYYPKCKTINDETGKDLKISNKMLQYCTNLPEIRKDQYDMVSGDQVELLDSSSPHIQIFPKQFDIGGQGIVHKDFNDI
jgi:hypothetical protein